MILYTTGTINQPDAGSVGLAMAERIRDDVVAHVAWDLVEEFTPAASAVRWYVFKCLAAQSGLPNDFYVIMGRTLSNGALMTSIAEGYSSASKVMSFFGPNPTSPVILYDAEGRRTNTFTLGTANFTTNTDEPFNISWFPGGTSTKWWITVDNDGFTVAFNGASNGFVHVGAYIPLTALPITMPLQLTGTSSSQGVITRNPAVASGTVTRYALYIDRAVLNLGFTGQLKYNDKLQNNQRPVGERGITMYRYAQGAEVEYGWALGKQKRMRIGDIVPVGVAFGDAYALAGKLWVPYLPTDGTLWDTGVASS